MTIAAPPAGLVPGVHRRVGDLALLTPDAPAVSCGDTTLTYAELDRHAEELAVLLRRTGVGKETPVGVHMTRCPELPVALLAVLKAGGSCVPLDPGYPTDRLDMVLTEVAAPVVLTTRALRAGLPARGALVVALDDPAQLAELRGREGTDPGPAPAFHPQALAWIAYTSGSTGRPKGVLLSHGPLSNLADGIAARLDLTPEDRVLQFASIGFSVAAEEFFSTWYAGACLVLDPDESLADSGALRAVIEEERVTVLQLTPAYWYEWLREVPRSADGAPVPPASLRLLVVGSEQVAADKVGEWLAGGVRLVQEYGATEGTVSQLLYETSAPARDVRTWARIPVGTPLDNVGVRIYDPELRPVEDGLPGELYIAGESVSRGYLARPGLTAERFLPDPGAGVPGGRMYRTGDLALRRPDGNVEFLGRIDHQLKVHGVRIEPGEVEAAIGRYPGVAKSAVLARESATGAAQLVACVVWDGEPDLAGLRGHLVGLLAPGLVPGRIVAVPELPLNPNGKVDRPALRELDLDDPRPRTEREGRPPRTALEAALAGIWAMVLGVPAVGAEDDYFLLGGDSLTATRLSASIREALGADVRQRMIFETPTVAALAARIEAERTASVRTEADRRASVADTDAVAVAVAVADADADADAVAVAVADTDEQPVPAGADPAGAGPARTAGHTAPATPPQRRMWLAHRMSPADAAYNEPLVLRLTGRCEPEHLQSALRGLVRRHAALRTTVRMQEGRLTQFIAPPGAADALTLALDDFTGRPDGDHERRLDELATAPFDLGRGPLTRAALLRLGAQEHVLAFVLHHIVCDGWSLDVLQRDLSRLYSAALTGRPAELPAPRLSYADYAALQDARAGGPQETEQLSYWTRQLAGAPEVTRLPGAPTVDPLRTGSVVRNFTVPPGTARRLRTLAATERATPYMVLLAGFQALTHRATGARDLVVGSLTSGRDGPELDYTVGLFTNVLALRTRIPQGATFRELVVLVREAVRGAVAHQDVPFEQVVEQIRPRRGLDHSPVFQLMFSYGNTTVRAPDLPGLEVSPITVDTRSAKFDVTVMVEELADGGFSGTFEYRHARFDEPTAARLTTRYESLVREVAGNPDAAL